MLRLTKTSARFGSQGVTAICKLPRVKPLFCGVIFLVLGLASLPAQNATPARPVDPSQPRPAQPVLPDGLTPPEVNLAPSSSTPVPAPPPTNAPPSSTVSVSIVADSSLKQVLQELAQSWADTQDSGPQVPLTLTNAGTLRTKVEGGTVWDVVISADVEDMRDLTAKGVLVSDGQRSLARNTLIVYGRKALVKDDELEWFDLIGTEWKKVALGNPDLVASGRVATRALQKHDLLGEDQKSIYVHAPTEIAALAVAEREQADAVFCYKTDLAKVSLPGFDVFHLSTADAPPIFYTAAVSKQARNPELAQAFILYCSSEAGQAIWAKYGFETN